MHISQIATLPPAQQEAIWNGLSDEEAQALLYDWTFIARPNQHPPPGDWFCWMLRSGRGFGKTRTGTEWVINRAKNGPYHPIALVGQTKADVRDTMIEVGDSSILKCSPPWFYPDYQPSKRRVIWPNGMVAMVYSGDEPDQLRGPQHGSAWVDEFAKFKYPEETWDNLMFGLRLGSNPQVVVTTTPRPIKILKQILSEAGTVDIRGSSYDNLDNLSSQYRERVLSRYEGTRLGRQEIYGEILEDTPGALWTMALIEQCRFPAQLTPPPMKRIVVGVDPAVTSKETSDETGIIVCGIDGDNNGYVLEDCTMRGSPQQWAGAVVSAYHRWDASRVVAEINQGGDMVENTLRQVDRSISYRAVHAAKSKYRRAEPISAQYEKGRVHHVGLFPELEDQMCSWVQGEDSPDRLDALVWAFNDLLLKPQIWVSV